MPDWESEVRLSERSRLHVWLSCLGKPGRGEVRGKEVTKCGPMATPSLVLHPICSSLSPLPSPLWADVEYHKCLTPILGGGLVSNGWVSCDRKRPLPFLLATTLPLGLPQSPHLGLILLPLSSLATSAQPQGPICGNPDYVMVLPREGGASHVLCQAE